MPLHLIEFDIESSDRATLQQLFDRIDSLARQGDGEVIEVQVANDLRRAYVVVEHPDQVALWTGLHENGLPPSDVAEVRLVGTTLDVLKAARPAANYLVEWDLPETLTMESYLARKKANSPLYANVPEVKFLRTYVREDMAKCLCFYDAPDDEAVRRAREAVSSPIDRLTRVSGGD